MGKDNFTSQTKNFFSKESYSGKARNLTIEVSKFTSARKFEFLNFFSFLDSPKNLKLIELGCGYGRFVLPLLNMGYEVTAVDISKSSLMEIQVEAKRKSLDKKLNIVESDFTKPMFLNKFDAAFCISTFHLLAEKEKDRKKILFNLVRSLKPCGTLMLIEPNPLNPFYYPFYLFSSQVSWQVEKYFMKSTEKNLRSIFREMGIANIKVKYVGFLPLRLIDSFPITAFINNAINRTPLFNKFSSFIYIKGIKVR